MSAEGLLREDAVSGHVGEIDSCSHAEQHLKQFCQELALLTLDLEVVDGRHFCEDLLKRSQYSSAVESEGCGSTGRRSGLWGRTRTTACRFFMQVRLKAARGVG
jgi:hypothetical protein